MNMLFGDSELRITLSCLLDYGVNHVCVSDLYYYKLNSLEIYMIISRSTTQVS
jgi:hypothetical protein